MTDKAKRDSDLRAWRQNMRLPVIAAPMFLVSGPELVIACCQAGVIGSFPTVNARSPEDLDKALDALVPEKGVRVEVRGYAGPTGTRAPKQGQHQVTCSNCGGRSGHQEVFCTQCGHSLA